MYIALSVTWIYASFRWRNRSVALLGLLALITLAWLSSNYPLQRLYGLLLPGDRIRNLSWCMTVAAGNSPLTTGVIGQIVLEPFWASLVAVASLMSPTRVLRIYPYLSLGAMIGLALVLYFHFRRPSFGERQDEASSPKGSLTPGDLRGLLVAFFVIILVSSPLEFAGPFRSMWARAFLLKPNHILGFVLIPVLLSTLAGGKADQKSYQRILLSGLLLGLLSWVFVVHWAFICFTFVLYLAVKATCAGEGFRRELWRLSVIVAISSLFVAPGLYVLYKYYPGALTLTRGGNLLSPMQSDWGEILPRYVSLFFIVTLDRGVVFYLSLVGVADWFRRRSRLGLLWTSQVIGAYLLWSINYGLYLTARAREADEFYFYLMFVSSVAAGNGAFVLAIKLFRWATKNISQLAAPVTATLVLTAVPLGLPYWWEPIRMDGHFRVALEPIPEHVNRLASWIRKETRGTDTMLAAGELIQWIPSFSGRPTLPASRQVLDALRSAVDGTSAEQGGTNSRLPSFNYLVWDPAMSEALGRSWAVLEKRSDFVLAVQVGHVRVYRRVETTPR